jgi:hydrogenase nickel incorporation protein HypB
MMAIRTIEVRERVMARNDELARDVRQRLAEHDVIAFNLVSSPGSGKTMLLERTLDVLGREMEIAVVTGDVQTQNDAERLARRTSHLVQAVVTGGACHLDALQVMNALDAIDLDTTDLLFIENVGNLVCPASFDLGQHRNVTLLSVTEGDDKPAKYPVMFRAADLVVLGKTDLLPHFEDFDPSRCERHVRALANPAPVLELSARSRQGLEQWLEWLRAETRAQRDRRADGQTAVPRVQSDGLRLHAGATSA